MHHPHDDQSAVPPATPITRRPLLRAMAGAGALGAFGLPRLAGGARAAIPGVDVDYQRCKVAFVSNASVLDRIAVYYADRDGTRQARYGIDPAATDPRGYEPLVVEYNASQDRTQVQLAEPRGSLVCVVAEGASGRVAVTNPNDICLPAGFNSTPTASFTVSADPTVGGPVTFTSTATDPDTPERLVYEWDLDGDGTFETTGATVSRTYATTGDVTVSHRVTDDCMAVDTATRTVTVEAAVPPVPSELVARLSPEDLGSEDFFGWAVAASDDHVIVGSRNHNESAINAGAVYVYDRADLTAQPTKLAPAAFGARFGSALTIVGETLVVGAPFDDGPVRDTGAVYLYDLTDLALPPTKLAPSTLTPGDRYGESVAVDGDTLVVGAAADRTVGSVYVHDLSDLAATPTILVDTDLNRGAFFGWAVAVGSGVVAVGAIQDDSAGYLAGSVYVYDLGDLSAPPRKLVPAELETRDSFGYSLDIENGRLAVGADRDDDVADDGGAVYVYELSDLGVAPTKVVPTDLSDGDRFGFSIVLSGDSLLVGALLGQDTGSDTGVLYVFDVTAPSAPPTKLAPERLSPNWRFGSSVATTGDVLVVGATYDSDDGYRRGSAFVYR